MFDFEAHLANIVEYLRGEFSSVPTVEEYPRLRKKITVPAVLVEVADLSPIDDPGTEQLAFSARIEARVVFDEAPTRPGGKPDMQCLSLATAVAQALFRQGWFGVPGAGPAKAFKVEPDHFKPELAAYCVWLVEWSHDIRLGDSVWDAAGILPTQIYLGIAPEIGPEHLDDYVHLGDLDG